ncbi:MAG: cysteine peptidase family C39 domain-containing protein [Anaerolineae bacterium]
MLDYLDNDYREKRSNSLRISGLIVLALAGLLCGAYVMNYGLPDTAGSHAQAQIPTPQATSVPTPTPRPGEFTIQPNDLVLPSAGRFATSGTQLLTRMWLRQVPMMALKNHLKEWADAHHTEYAQKYYLSCEAAVIRMALAPLGIHLTEDEILADMPYDPVDPEKGMVITDIDGSTFNEDGTINWSNYGAHPPVLEKVLEHYLYEFGLSDLVQVEIQALNDDELIQLIGHDTRLIGAIIWVARGQDNKPPPTNERGQVLGEHVQWVAPVLDAEGSMLIYDVWPWPNQPFRRLTTLNRQLFQYRTVLLRRVNTN